MKKDETVAFAFANNVVLAMNANTTIDELTEKLYIIRRKLNNNDLYEEMLSKFWDEFYKFVAHTNA